jgi:hypothetical protein
MFERRQRLRIERTGRRRIDRRLFLFSFLRGDGAGQREEDNGTQAGSNVHQRLFLTAVVALLSGALFAVFALLRR